MKLSLKNTKAHSKTLIILLLLCIVFVLVLIFSNLYILISGNGASSRINDSLATSEISNTSYNFNENMEFISNSIVCGDSDGKHIRNFVNSSGNTDLYGIRFLVVDSNGANHTYLNNTRESLPFSGSVKRIDVTYSELNLDSSYNLTEIYGSLIFKDNNGNEILGSSIQSVDVCYSSCNDCSAACEIVCP